MRKLFAFAAAFVAAATPFALAQPALSDNVVRIGVLTDMSSLYADIGGVGSVEAARMATEDFGGVVLGQRIEVLSADHYNKADAASQTVRRWLDEQGVDMIVDSNNSAVALAVSKLVTDKKRILMAGGVGTTRLTNEDCSPYVAHWIFDSYALANGTAGAAVRAGKKSWYFVTVDYAFGHSLEQDAAQAVVAAGGNVIGQVRHPLNAPDFSSFILRAQSSKAEVIGVASAGGDTINTIKAAHEFGLTKNQSLAGLLVFITDVHSLGLPVTQGMLLTEAWYWDLNDETRAFSKRFFEKRGRMPTMTQAGVYSATLSYLKAVRAAGTDQADKVMAALRNMRIDDMFARNGYLREDGRMMHDMYLLEVKKPSESKGPWDYYHVRATIPAEEAFQPLSKSRCPRIVKTTVGK